MSFQEIGEQWAECANPVRSCFLGACLIAAAAIKNEVPETANHVKRLAWADVILAGDDAAVLAKVIQHVRYALATNATFQADPRGVAVSSADYVVNSQIDILA